LAASDRIKFLSPDARTYIMILNCAEEADLGVYECKATNKVGTLSSKAQLLITGTCYTICAEVLLTYVSIAIMTALNGENFQVEYYFVFFLHL
jgi:hypothetical protein